MGRPFHDGFKGAGPPGERCPQPYAARAQAVKESRILPPGSPCACRGAERRCHWGAGTFQFSGFRKVKRHSQTLLHPLP